MMKTYIRQLGCLGLLYASTVAAQQPESEIENIEVVAHPLSGEGLSQAVEVLSGEELEQKLATNLGDTLAKEPGIHSASFGEAVGRPVIHGLSGPRVRVMEDRIDTLDVSVSSGDHAVSIDPFIANRIEVIKGAGTLLYGSGAIGGVVDVHTGRIPHQVPEEAITGGIETRFNNNNDGTTTAFKLDGGQGKFAWHLDGSLKDANNYEIPGFTESSAFRAQEEAEEADHGDEDEHEEGETRGSLPGSWLDTESVAGGGSYIADWGFIGLAVSHMDAQYGLPGGHGHEEEEGHDDDDYGEEEDESATPILDLEQTRTDFELGIENPFANFESLNVRVGYNDYEHQEIEPNGEVATEFTNKAWEARTELVYKHEQWLHVFGLQYTDREFSAIGEEAFIPPVDTQEGGVFWVAERSFENFDLEMGLRTGRVEHSPEASSDQSFNTYSGSLGAVIPLSDGLQLGLNLDLSSRAPVSEELFSNGPHLVTNTFELGNEDLDNEKALNLSTTLQYQSDNWSATVTGYYTDFSDFIYQQATGDEEDELPVVAYQQEDATFYGIDAELAVKLMTWQDGELGTRLILDYVRAQLDISGNDNIPRTPPTRFGVGFDAKWGKLTSSVDILRVQEQDDLADLELVSEAYNDLSLYLNYALFTDDRTSLDIFLHGKNLTDDEQRVHTSFIKDVAPAPGRSLEVGVRLSF